MIVTGSLLWGLGVAKDPNNKSKPQTSNPKARGTPRRAPLELMSQFRGSRFQDFWILGLGVVEFRLSGF